MLALVMEGPVGVPVVGEADGAEVEDGMGTVRGPAHTGLLEAVLDEVAAGALDDAGADRPAVTREQIVARLWRETVTREVIQAQDRSRRPEPATGSDGEETCTVAAHPALAESEATHRAMNQLLVKGPVLAQGLPRSPTWSSTRHLRWRREMTP